MENKWFKKTMLLLTAACLTFSVTGCKGEKVMDTVLEKTDTKKEAEEEKEEKPEVPVKKPELSMNLSGSVTYNVGTAAGALQVEAVASDGAEITYQWYKSFTNTNGGGTVIKNATKNTFTPPTKEAGTTYYYAVATSTIGNSTNRVTSDTIEVIVSENPEQPENAEGGEKPAQEPAAEEKPAEENKTEEKESEKKEPEKKEEENKPTEEKGAEGQPAQQQ